MKIGVIGANGQLGTDTVEVLKSAGHKVVPINHDKTDITDFESLYVTMKDVRPDVVINTAAFHNVPLCEREPLRAFEVNGRGAKNLAELSVDFDYYLIHISTDYVFDGAKQAPYTEEDAVMPLNVYANTKVAGEYFVQAIAERHTIVRSSGLYGKSPCRAKGGKNFADLMMHLSTKLERLRVVDAEILTPTSTLEIARQLAVLCENEAHGLCHATAEGACSWNEFAHAIFEIKGIKTPIDVADPSEFAVNFKRPTYSVLENKFLKDRDLNIFKHWRDALKEYLEG